MGKRYRRVYALIERHWTVRNRLLGNFDYRPGWFSGVFGNVATWSLERSRDAEMRRRTVNVARNIRATLRQREL